MESGEETGQLQAPSSLLAEAKRQLEGEEAQCFNNAFTMEQEHKVEVENQGIIQIP